VTVIFKGKRSPSTLVITALLVLSIPFLGPSCGSKQEEAEGPADWTILGLDVPNYATRAHEIIPVEDRASFRHYKLEVRWGKVQPRQGAFDWSYYDEQIAAILSDGSQSILLLLGGPVPEWAMDATNGSFADRAPPADLNYWRVFCAAVAARYGPVADFYEIWNEPGWDRDSEVYDLFGTFHFGGQVEKDYLPLLQAGYGAIKENDPTGIVICGALMNTLKDDPQAGTELYTLLFGDADFSSACDMISVHPYKMPGNWGPYYANLSETLRSIGVDKELVVTEVGWPNYSDDDASKFSEQQQADAIGVWGIEPLREAGCRKIWIYKDLDEPPGRSWDKCYYGMFAYDGTPHPSWQNYKYWQTENPSYPTLPPALPQ
jgi:hypothetical protein